MKEKHTSVILKKENGKYDSVILRGEIKKHSQLNFDHSVKVGDFVFFHGDDMYHTKVEGHVVAIRTCIWDYSMPLGRRAIDEKKTEGYDIYKQLI